MENKKSKPKSKPKSKTKKSKGLGDTVAKITEVTGIKKLVGDCEGCNKRQEKLNKMFSYKRDLNQEEREQWKLFINREKQDKISVKETRFILKLLKECLGMSVKPCYNCGKASWDVWIKKINDKYDG